MSKIEIPVVYVKDFLEGGEKRDAFVKQVGDALRDIGFFAVADHGIPQELIKRAYQASSDFYDLDVDTKKKYEIETASGQRGYTSMYKEHAKDSGAPDIKEFYQVGRVDVTDDHEVHQAYGPNVWPTEIPDFSVSIQDMYRKLDGLGKTLLEACALYLDEEQGFLTEMVDEGDTIVRVLYYPPLPADVPAGAIRAAAHEDINLITLLPGSTASGLEILGRDGEWLAVEAHHEHIIVDSGDMMQNLTNGLLRSTTHRVVNPADPTTKRFSMPCFIHPKRDADLTPRPKCVAQTGGEAKFPALSAGEYLRKRLEEIGIA